MELAIYRFNSNYTQLCRFSGRCLPPWLLFTGINVWHWKPKKISNKLHLHFWIPLLPGELSLLIFKCNVAVVLWMPGAADRVYDNRTVTADIWDWYGCHCLSSLILMHSDVVYLCLTRMLIELISQFASDLHAHSCWIDSCGKDIFVRGEKCVSNRLKFCYFSHLNTILFW